MTPDRLSPPDPNKKDPESTRIIKQLYDSQGQPIGEDLVQFIATGQYKRVGFYGPSGIGKTTQANAIEEKLTREGVCVIRLNQEKYFRKYKKIFEPNVQSWSIAEHRKMLKEMYNDIAKPLPKNPIDPEKPTIMLFEAVGVGEDWKPFMKKMVKRKDTFFVFFAGDPRTLELSTRIRQKIKQSPDKTEELLREEGIFPEGIDNLSSAEKTNILYKTISQTAPPDVIRYFVDLMNLSPYTFASKWFAPPESKNSFTISSKTIEDLYNEPLPKFIEELPERELANADKNFIRAQLFLYDIYLNFLGLQDIGNLLHVGLVEMALTQARSLVALILYTKDPKYIRPYQPVK